MPEGGTGFIDLPGERKEVGTDWDKEEGWKQECCGAGDLVLIHGTRFEQRQMARPHLKLLKNFTGSVQHQSPHNLSGKTRFIYTFHMIEGQDGYTYDERNW